ncbi:MAG: M36 family metallopeptidase, partial [Chloroflexi bacterium]|nr:M36 family metallopeptidase [Chloroflexota bacterium]
MNRSRYLFQANILACLLLVAILLLVGPASARTQLEATSSAPTSGVSSPVPGGFLTGPNSGEPLDIALAYIRDNRVALGLTEADVTNLVVDYQYVSQHTGVTHIYLYQQHQGLDVFNAILNINITSDGRVLNLGNRFVGNVAGAANGRTPGLSAVEAVEAAAARLRLTIAEPLEVQEVIGGAAQEVVLSEGGISQRPIPVRLVYQPVADGSVRLAWDLSIYELSGENWWSMRVDAANGAVLAQDNWVTHDDWGAQAYGHGGSAGQGSSLVELSASLVPSSYLVYAMPVESPNYTVPAPPADARTTEVEPWLDASAPAAPEGWHATSSTSWTNTQGNNVDAHKGAVRFDCGATLECDPPLDLTMEPTIPGNVDAATVNLFYWNNIIHDLTYDYGFDEVGGNFQQDNFGMGGLGNDRVNANAQAPGNCNANFGTPPDGSPPTMNMFTCNIASPSRDGDLDNGVIAHEYGHGISNRLTGGPGNVNCLNNAEQMGEGWSDWLGLMMSMEVGDQGTDSRPIGTWLLGEGPTGPGVRPTPYSTDMGINPTTYGDIGSLAIPHGVGYAWAQMLWEVNWLLIAEHGFNTDFYADWSTGGNNLTFQLVIDGMKLQPCSPGFVDGRDAILAADMALTGGDNQCLIWEGFAKRGLGFSADQGSSGSTTDGTEAFDIPSACEFMGVIPASQDICQGQTAEYEVTVGPAYTPPVDMSASGHPAGTTATFSVDPVVTVPSTTTLTIGNTGSATAGNYNIDVVGADTTNTFTVTVGLNVYSGAPGAPTLTAPANGAIDVPVAPTYQWTAVAGAAWYELEVATDVAFTTIVYTATEATNSHTPTTGLDPLTTYYWRVRAANPCAAGANSAVFSFTTEDVPPILLVDDDDNSPNVQATYVAALNALGAEYDIWDTNNSDNEPSVALMAPYHTIIWFTGDEFGGFAGPGATAEGELTTWLNNGNCLFISSQDYHYDRGLTPFIDNY